MLLTARLSKWMHRVVATGAVVAALFVGERTARGQLSGIPIIRDSSVGYIDTAVPGNIVRFRYDAAFNNRQPSRAEFFYPRSGAAGPGPPERETGVDYQELWAYGELARSDRLAAFVDVPVRFLNPEVNDSAAGFGDLQAGFKYSLIHCPDLVMTAQLRAYAPTGNARRGLGTHHVSLEPGLLIYRQLSQQLCLEGELRYWVPIDGTDFAGDVIRYGIGLSVWLPPGERWQLTPVVEVVGWTVLDGLTGVSQGPGIFAVESAAGDTIVNLKTGLRTRIGPATDLYLGYGQPLTGDPWYENTLRAELRWLY